MKVKVEKNKKKSFHDLKKNLFRHSDTIKSIFGDYGMKRKNQWMSRKKKYIYLLLNE